VSQTEAEKVDLVIEDQLEEMIGDVQDDVFQHSHMYDTLCNDAEIPLYPGCTKFTRLLRIIM